MGIVINQIVYKFNLVNDFYTWDNEHKPRKLPEILKKLNFVVFITGGAYPLVYFKKVFPISLFLIGSIENKSIMNGCGKF